jgi:hypothetical protein
MFVKLLTLKVNFQTVIGTSNFEISVQTFDSMLKNREIIFSTCLFIFNLRFGIK